MMKQMDMTRRRAATRIATAAIATMAPTAALATPHGGGSKIEFLDPMAASALAQGGHDLSPVGMFEGADGFVKTVIVLLLIASVLTWTIGVAKWRELKGERRRLAAAVRKLASAADVASVGETGYAPLSDMIVSAEDEIAASGWVGGTQAQGVKERIALRLDVIEAELRRRVSRGVAVLAMVSSTAPFVGLVGTVWGIMNSFIGIAHSHTTNLAVVAPGIAEALLTTAVGLIAAIPAAILFNVFARMLSVYGGELGGAAAAVRCLAARDIDRADVAV